MGKIRIILKKEKGITLIEVLVTLAILSLVLLLGYNLFMFGTTSYQATRSQLDIQTAFRLQAISITKEIRNATDISFDSGDSFEKLNLSYVEDLSNYNASFTLLESNEGGTYFLKFSLNSNPGIGQDKELESEILLNNIRNINEDVQNALGEPQENVYFKKP